MKINDQNYWSMLKGEISYLDQHSETWQSLKPVAAVVENLKRINREIDEAALTQASGDTTGHTRQKDNLFDTMTQRAQKIADKVAAFAMVANNMVLLKAVNYSATSLNSGTEQEVVKRCQVIMDTAREHIEALGDYNLTPDILTELENDIAAYNAILGEREVTAAERINARQSIPELISQARAEFKVLDKLVTGMIDDEDFVNGYFIEHAIKNRRGSRTQANGEEETEQ